MKVFELHRTGEKSRSTAGMLEDDAGRQLCATLERSEDDRDHPRIPPGDYNLKIRPFGQSHFDDHNRAQFGDTYAGIIEICNVSGRTNIEIHMGNWWFQTEGCVLAGASVRLNPAKQEFEIPPGMSAPGFWEAYCAIRLAIKDGGAVLRVLDVHDVAIA